MKTCYVNRVARTLALLLAFALAFVQGSALAQSRPAYAFSQQQLDQMLAPVALYPDALLSQILMASTYPLEVVEAARWSQARPGLSGDEAVRAAAREDWDPSVKSLVAFPQVLARMNEDLEWTQSLGDAFLDQEPQVMDTVQNLRRRAQTAGNLRSDDRMRVFQEGQIVVVQSVNPEVVYVPYYNPLVVYGSWWWPAPPIHWQRWPGYYARPGFASFYWGPSIRVSVGFFFGGFDWTQRQVRVVHVNNYYYGAVNRTVIVNRAPGAWQHDPDRRGGVAYRSAAVQQRFGMASVRPDRGRPAGSVDERRSDARMDARSDARFDGRRSAARPEARSGAEPHVNGVEPRVNGQGQRAQATAQAAAQPAADPRIDGRRQRSSEGQARAELVGNRQEVRNEPNSRLEGPRAGEPRGTPIGVGPRANAPAQPTQSALSVPDARIDGRRQRSGDAQARTEMRGPQQVRHELGPRPGPRASEPRPEIRLPQAAVREPAASTAPRREPANVPVQREAGANAAARHEGASTEPRPDGARAQVQRPGDHRRDASG